MSSISASRLLLGFLALLALGTSADTQPVADHLQCYKITDPQAKGTYTADVGGLVAEPGCTIKVPAVVGCVPATKTNVTPTPPGGGAVGTPNSFFCYKTKCPKAVLPKIAGQDQFGTRTVTPGAAKLLCAPVTLSTTPTSTTTSTTIPCSPPCGTGMCCGGVCTDTTNDPSNCGSCGHQCLAGETCVGSQCTCSPPNTFCGTQCNLRACSCSDLLTDSSNCGFCGNACPVGTDCQGGTCVKTCCEDQDCRVGTEFCCSHTDWDSTLCPYPRHCAPAFTPVPLVQSTPACVRSFQCAYTGSGALPNPSFCCITQNFRYCVTESGIGGCQGAIVP
jgi:hypothetical protein